MTFAAGQVKEACHDMKGTARDLEDALCKVADAAVPSDVAEVFRNAKEAARAFSNVLGANGERLDNAFTAVEMSQKVRGEMANKAPPKSKYTPSPSRGPPSPAPSRSTSWTPSRRVVTPKDGTTGDIISAFALARVTEYFLGSLIIEELRVGIRQLSITELRASAATAAAVAVPSTRTRVAALSGVRL